MPNKVSGDVLVVGGGPAGLAAAIAVRLQGFAVTVVEAARPPIDKACGEAVLPAGVRVLRRLGVQVSQDEGFALRGIRFVSGHASVEATFQRETGLALRRTRLHQALLSRAFELGVRLLWGSRAEVADFAFFGWIIGADGQNSRVRQAVGLAPTGPGFRRFGFRRHYRIDPWTDFVEVHWGSRCQIYVTPIGRREVGIALLSRDPHLRLESALSEFPELRRRLHRADASSQERGAVTVSRRLKRVSRGRIALVGDASGSVDAITGDGLTLAFQQALALSAALRLNHMPAYEADHRRLMRRPAFMADLLLCLDRSSLLRRLVFPMLARQPLFFEALLKLHAPADRLDTSGKRQGIRRSTAAPDSTLA